LWRILTEILPILFIGLKWELMAEYLCRKKTSAEHGALWGDWKD